MPANPADRMAALLAGLWQRNRPQVLERLATLEHAATALTTNTLTPELHEQAIATAHKLAGTLGMYGYPQGTELARQLEQHLDQDAIDPALITSLTHQLRATLDL